MSIVELHSGEDAGAIRAQIGKADFMFMISAEEHWNHLPENGIKRVRLDPGAVVITCAPLKDVSRNLQL